MENAVSCSHLQNVSVPKSVTSSSHCSLSVGRQDDLPPTVSNCVINGPVLNPVAVMTSGLSVSANGISPAANSLALGASLLRAVSRPLPACGSARPHSSSRFFITSKLRALTSKASSLKTQLDAAQLVQSSSSVMREPRVSSASSTSTMTSCIVSSPARTFTSASASCSSLSTLCSSIVTRSRHQSQKHLQLSSEVDCKSAKSQRHLQLSCEEASYGRPCVQRRTNKVKLCSKVNIIVCTLSCTAYSCLTRLIYWVAQKVMSSFLSCNYKIV